MEAIPAPFRADQLGVITADANDLPPLVGPDGQPITGVKYVWRPSPEVMDQLPDGFTFPMRCVAGPDGLRRFYPSSVDGLIATAFQGGLAILTLLGQLSPEQRFSYRAMYLLFDRVRQTREHLGNTLLNPDSLRISRVARDVAEERTILPASIGQNARGEGAPWSVDRLLEEGRQAAQAAGVRRPSEKDCVHYGLVAAARRNPLLLRDEESADGLVRMALYEYIPADEPLEPGLVDLIVERTLLAMQTHLTQPAGEFNKWFSGPKNSFVQQVARRKLLPGGVLDRDLVRRALLELGWRSYTYVADCIHTMMRVFQRLFPEPLSATEEAVFEQMHLKQSYLGNLPLVLLFERFRFLNDVLWEIWQNPGDPGPIAVLHRLLDYYGEMASARRAVDRTVQQRRAGRTQPEHRSPLTVPFESFAPVAEEDTANEEKLAVPEPHPDTVLPETFDRVAEMVREHRQVKCSCALPQWEDSAAGWAETEVTIKHVCSSCGFTAESTLSVKEVASLVGAGLRD